jgi:uncharacterized protein (TIRG00374 family)
VKRYLIGFLKIVIPIGIIIWLLASIEPGQLQALRDRPKNWMLLAAAFGLSFVAICITFLRWYLLVRTIDLPFRLRDAFRLGFLGYLLNFVSVGAVGGDLFKAFFIAHEQPSRRAEAVATVVVDRMIGLYALLLVTSAAIFLSDIPDPTPALSAICTMTYGATAIGGVGVLMVLIPGFTRGSLSQWLSRLPKVGGLIEQLLTSVRIYRNKKLVMSAILGMSMGVHSLFAVALYLIAIALFETSPTLPDHLIIVPLSMVAGALPFTPAGLGTFEYAMGELYVYVPAAGPVRDIGILVALAFRLVTIAIATIGVGFYWACRREVQEVMHEAEEAQKHHHKS